MLPLSSLSQVFDFIGRLSEEQFAPLATLIGTERSFSPSKKDIDYFARSVSLPRKDIEILLGALSFLYSRLGELKLPSGERASRLEELVREASDAESEEREAIAQRLDKLLAVTENHERFQKIGRLEKGFLASAVSFDSLVDMRPDFNEGVDEIKGYIPIITFNVLTNSPDPSMRSISFNVPLDKLDELQHAVERLTRKIGTLKSSLAA